jgi:hypothetical protein
MAVNTESVTLIISVPDRSVCKIFSNSLYVEWPVVVQRERERERE